MTIEDPNLYGGRGFVPAKDQSISLTAPEATNEFWETGDAPKVRNRLTGNSEPYGEASIRGATIAHKDPATGAIELLVNVVPEVANPRKWNRTMLDGGAILYGGNRCYENDAVMAADGWTMLANPNRNEIKSWAPPIEFDGVRYGDRSKPANRNWWYGWNRVGFGDEYPEGDAGAGEWTSCGYLSPIKYSGVDFTKLDFFISTNGKRQGADWLLRMGYRTADFGGRHWLIFRCEQKISGFYAADGKTMPTEIWLSSTDGAFAYMYGEWGDVFLSSSDRNDNWEWANGIEAGINTACCGASANGVPLLLSDPAASAKWYKYIDGMNFGFYYLSNLGDPAPQPQWKKVDMVWPKINPDTGYEITPYDSWPGGNLIAGNWG